MAPPPGRRIPLGIRIEVTSHNRTPRLKHIPIGFDDLGHLINVLLKGRIPFRLGPDANDVKISALYRQGRPCLSNIPQRVDPIRNPDTDSTTQGCSSPKKCVSQQLESVILRSLLQNEDVGFERRDSLKLLSKLPPSGVHRSQTRRTTTIPGHNSEAVRETRSSLTSAGAEIFTSLASGPSLKGIRPFRSTLMRWPRSSKPIGMCFRRGVRLWLVTSIRMPSGIRRPGGGAIVTMSEVWEEECLPYLPWM